MDYDVAIVQLSTPAALSNKIVLAKIAGPNYNLPDGEVVQAIGWGTLSVNNVLYTNFNHQQIISGLDDELAYKTEEEVLRV